MCFSLVPPRWFPVLLYLCWDAYFSVELFEEPAPSVTRDQRLCVPSRPSTPGHSTPGSLKYLKQDVHRLFPQFRKPPRGLDELVLRKEEQVQKVVTKVLRGVLRKPEEIVDLPLSVRTNRPVVPETRS